MSHISRKKLDLVNRTKKVIGQPESVLKGLHDDEQCSEILRRLAAARGAINSLMGELMEVMPYDPSRPAIFPHNGHTLTDDAADAFLAVLTNGKVTGGKVGPHRDLLAEFPYLWPPHNS